MCDVRVLTVYKRGGGGPIQQCGLPKKSGSSEMESPTPLLFFFFLSLSLFSSRFYSFLCVCVEYHIEFHFFVSILRLRAFIFWSRLF